MGKTVVGIDLGATDACVALALAGRKPQAVPSAEGARTIPAVVGFTPSGELLVGFAAKRQAVTNASRTLRHARRLLFEKADKAHALGARKITAEEACGAILEVVRETAEAYAGETIDSAVLCGPTWIDDAQRDALVRAAQNAGLEVAAFLFEPLAAVLAHGLEKEEGAILCVYDLGGVSFAVTILQVVGGEIVLRGEAREAIGGDDFDERIADALIENAEKKGVDLRKDVGALARVRDAAEKAKNELSSSPETEINLSFIGKTPGGEPFHVIRTISRMDLELITGDLVEQTIEACGRAIEAAGIERTEVRHVILSGGSTRMTPVREAVKSYFKREPARGIAPDEVIAVGAAMYAVTTFAEVPVAAAVVKVEKLEVAPARGRERVTPLTLALETGGGDAIPIVPRGTPIPVERSFVFTTSVDAQTWTPIHVLIGERDASVDMRTLVRFDLTGIQRAPRGGARIEVKIAVDAASSVTVTARDLASGRKREAKAGLTGDLSLLEIARALDEGERHRYAEQAAELARLRVRAEELLLTADAVLADPSADASALGDVVQLSAELRGLLGSSTDGGIILDIVNQLEAAAVTVLGAGGAA
jgi:molecular chaperone DnaK